MEDVFQAYSRGYYQPTADQEKPVEMAEMV
jgi:hypothetical protein